MLKAGVTNADCVLVSEPNEERRKYIADTFKVRTEPENSKVCECSEVVVMAVKPQVLDAVLKDLQTKQVKPGMLISIVAGKTLKTYETYLPDTRVARVMPNTPSLVGCGASVFVLNSICRAEDAATVSAVMGSCGIVEQVANEGLLDAVTGLSGSGPAYVYMMIEAMSDGGVKMGLPRDLSMEFAAQTVMGAAKMVLERKMHPGVLKNQVESP